MATLHLDRAEILALLNVLENQLPFPLALSNLRSTLAFLQEDPSSWAPLDNSRRYYRGYVS